MKLPLEYLRIQKEHGIPMSVLNPASSEFALDRNSALLALGSLMKSGIAVLGGDVLRADHDVIEYICANWSCSIQVNESRDQYSERSLQFAINYVSNFSSKATSAPLFVIVLDAD